MSSYLDNANSTTSPLLDGDTFYGSSNNINKYQGVLVTCKTDQSGLLSIAWSNDLSNFDHVASHPVTGGTAFYVVKQNLGTYVKVSFENNSGVNQTYLRLYTRYVNDVPDGVSVTIDPIFIRSQLWNNYSITNGTTSDSVELTGASMFDIFGTCTGACILLVQVSDDDAVFYDSSFSLVCNAGDIHGSITLASKYVRIWYQGFGTETITLFLHAKN